MSIYDYMFLYISSSMFTVYEAELKHIEKWPKGCRADSQLDPKGG